MTDSINTSNNDLLAHLVRISRAPTWFAFFGVVSLVIGILVVVWPGHTLVALAVLFGLALVVSGLFRMVAAVALPDITGGGRALMAVLGLLGLLIGLYCLRHIDLALSVLALLLGIYWIIDGITEVLAAIAHPGLPGRGWVGAGGLLAMIAGIVVLVWPAPTLVVLAVVLGIWLIVFGILQLSIAYGLHKAAQLDA